MENQEMVRHVGRAVIAQKIVFDLLFMYAAVTGFNAANEIGGTAGSPGYWYAVSTAFLFAVTIVLHLRAMLAQVQGLYLQMVGNEQDPQVTAKKFTKGLKTSFTVNVALLVAAYALFMFTLTHQDLTWPAKT
jgi:hypothetical protein